MVTLGGIVYSTDGYISNDLQTDESSMQADREGRIEWSVWQITHVSKNLNFDAFPYNPQHVPKKKNTKNCGE